MNLNVTIDWKFVLALGVDVVGIIFAVKMDATAAERVLTCMIDTHKGCVIAGNGSC